MIKAINNILEKKGLSITRKDNLERLLRAEKDLHEMIDMFCDSKLFQGNNKSQVNQDIFVLLATNFKRNGYFVEFGATNGVDLSNTYLLEKSYNWSGILAEPAKIWQDDLKINRIAKIDFSCVWRTSNNTIKFNMTDIPELSTISNFNLKDSHAKHRKNGQEYEVRTISLLDLLAKHNAPKDIDYLSIDTEGSEFEILESFDFSKYKISIITVEHNYTNDREKIYKLLIKNGFVRKFTEISKCDDWYLSSDLMKSI